MAAVDLGVGQILDRTERLDPASPQYSWKLFDFRWDAPAPGEHTLVSRVTDAAGRVQPIAAELETKLTFLENNAQFARRVRI